MHWLTGSNPKTDVYKIWKDTGALSDDVPLSSHDPFYAVEWEGHTISLYRDIVKTANHLSKISPQDIPLINRLVKDVKAVSHMQMPVFDIKGVKAEYPKKMSPKFLFTMLPALPALSRLGKITSDEFVQQFSHPALQRLFRIVPDAYAASSLIFTLATFHTDDGEYPEGGSLAMAHRMAKTFTDLGGELLLNTRVQKVNIQNGRAVGVLTADETIEADAVIVAQETVAALAHLFDTLPQDTWLKELSETVKPLSCTFVSVGVQSELPDGILPEWKLETPVLCAGQAIHEISFNSYRRYAPEGGTALTAAFLNDTYDYWKKAKDEGRYEQEKQALAQQISHTLCQKYPQSAGKIEVIDIATPLTYERYTGAYRGSWMGVVEPGDKMRQYLGTCENISGLYFAGHRLMPPGGQPTAAASGRQAAQLVCRQFGVVLR